LADDAVLRDVSIWFKTLGTAESFPITAPSAVFQLARIEDGVLTGPGELDLAPDAIHAAIAAKRKWVLD
jgi:hypothetical protein